MDSAGLLTCATVLLLALMSLYLLASYRMARETFSSSSSSPSTFGPIGVNDNRKILDPRKTSDKAAYEHNVDYPSVDGTADGVRSLSMFGYNKMSPECCPNTYSGEGGCVCETETQRKLISSRGMNKTHPEYPNV